MAIPNSNTRRNAIDLTGRKFGRWTVIRYDGKRVYSGGSTLLWLVRCDCGTEKTVAGNTLGKGSESCGCLHKEKVAQRFLKHGASRGNQRPTPEYTAWSHMLQRCENTKCAEYENYGGRGITVSDEWHDASIFLRDMGPKPSPKHSLERIDNSKGYSRENCKWATSVEQCNNTRRNVLLTFEDRTQTAAQWAREKGLTYKMMERRLLNEWTTEEILSIPASSDKQGHDARRRLKAFRARAA